jgi:hypothetical protein
MDDLLTIFAFHLLVPPVHLFASRCGVRTHLLALQCCAPLCGFIASNSSCNCLFVCTIRQ